MGILNRRWRRGLYSCGAALLALTIRVAPADDGQAAEQPQPATISGSVVNEKGEPVEATRVTVWSFKDEPRRHWERVGRPSVQSDGTFDVIPLHPPLSVMIRADVEGCAPGWASMPLSEGGPARAEIVVSPARRMELAVRDVHDQPIAGARLRWMAIDGPNGSIGFGGEAMRDMNLPRPTSDEQGRMVINGLPRGATLELGVMHSKHAPAEAMGLAIDERAQPVSLMMPEGVPLTLHVESPEEARISEVLVDVRHEPFKHPSTIVFETLSVDEDGVATLMVEPGSYRFLRLLHPEYLIGPILSARIAEQEFMRIDESNSVFHFRASPKVEIRGHVIDATTGAPITDQWVRGQIPNVGPGGNVPENESPWMHGDMAKTDQEGRYSLKLAPGRARVSFTGKGFIGERDFLELDVAPDGSTEAPPFKLTPTAPVSGQVVGPDDQPMEGVLVRFRGSHLRYRPPVLTDPEGRFVLEVPFIPLDGRTDERIARHPVVAFHPQQPWVGVEWIELDQPGSLSNVTIVLKERPDADLTTLIPGELTAWERGEVDDARKSALAAVSLLGQPAPELDGRQWLNTRRPQMSLADYRGKYVLLDFWTTWCGPCHADLPSLKLLRKVYGGEDFEIIGVHDNSVTPEKIAEHVRTEGIEFPIVIDHADGRILREYESHGIHGYPSYVLLGPDGCVLTEDRTVCRPSLRVYKLEHVRARLLDADEH